MWGQFKNEAHANRGMDDGDDIRITLSQAAKMKTDRGVRQLLFSTCCEAMQFTRACVVLVATAATSAGFYITTQH